MAGMSTPVYNFHYPALSAFTFVVSLKEGDAPFSLPDGGSFSAVVQVGAVSRSAVCDFLDGVLTVRVPQLYTEAQAIRRQCHYVIYLVLNGGASPVLQGQLLLDPLLPSPVDVVTGEAVEVRMQGECVVLNASVCVGAQGTGGAQGEFLPAKEMQQGYQWQVDVPDLYITSFVNMQGSMLGTKVEIIRKANTVIGDNDVLTKNEIINLINTMI